MLFEVQLQSQNTFSRDWFVLFEIIYLNSIYVNLVSFKVNYWSPVVVSPAVHSDPPFIFIATIKVYAMPTMLQALMNFVRIVTNDIGSIVIKVNGLGLRIWAWYLWDSDLKCHPFLILNVLAFSSGLMEISYIASDSFFVVKELHKYNYDIFFIEFDLSSGPPQGLFAYCFSDGIAYACSILALV